MKTIISLIFINCCVLFQNEPPKSLNYVPSDKVAIKIAEAVWLPIYGEKVLNYKPYVATLKDKKIWIVTGTLKNGLGGVPYAEIQKSDGKILTISHGK